MSSLYDRARPPGFDEIELHVYGRGYGEAIAIHLGNGHWMAVDSARSVNGVLWVFEYLDAIGVARTRVTDLLLTHWHTDHIAGASEILSQAPDARLILSNCGRSEEFVRLVAECSGSRFDPTKAIAFEMYELLGLVRNRKLASGRGNFRFVGRDTLLNFEQIPDAHMLMLSPSELDCVAALAYFAELTSSRTGTAGSVTVPENHASVVLLLQISNDMILLGADRENHPDQERGWAVVLDSKKHMAAGMLATAYKVSHHGSVTGYCPTLWPDHLTPDCMNIVTPYVKQARPIPNREMLQRYKLHSPNLLCTSLPRQVRSRHRSQISGAGGPKIRFEGAVGVGSVRLRKRNGGEHVHWTVELFGAAERL
jgi:hypothetical protein